MSMMGSLICSYDEGVLYVAMMGSLICSHDGGVLYAAMMGQSYMQL